MLGQTKGNLRWGSGVGRPGLAHLDHPAFLRRSIGAFDDRHQVPPVGSRHWGVFARTHGANEIEHLVDMTEAELDLTGTGRRLWHFDGREGVSVLALEIAQHVTFQTQPIRRLPWISKRVPVKSSMIGLPLVVVNVARAPDFSLKANTAVSS